MEDSRGVMGMYWLEAASALCYPNVPRYRHVLSVDPDLQIGVNVDVVILRCNAGKRGRAEGRRYHKVEPQPYHNCHGRQSNRDRVPVPLPETSWLTPGFATALLRRRWLHALLTYRRPVLVFGMLRQCCQCSEFLAASLTFDQVTNVKRPLTFG
jgi:hypothetical protein